MPLSDLPAQAPFATDSPHDLGDGVHDDERVADVRDRLNAAWTASDRAPVKAQAKLDAQGALLRSLQFMIAAPQPIELGGETLRLPASSMGYILAENLKQERATVAGTVPPGKSVHARRIPIDPGIFALERLGAGK